MRRLRLAVVAVVLPSGLAAIPYGCGTSEPPLENLCGFLGDRNNCQRTFFEHVGARCGAKGVGKAPKGSFLGRDALDVCVLQQGGQVLFDPGLEISQFPLTGPINLKFIDGSGDECGGVNFSGTYNFAVTINSYPPDGGVASTSGAGGSGSGSGVAPTCQTFGVGGGAAIDAAGVDNTVICGGTFSATTPEGRDILDTSCPGNETHHFDRLQIGKCPEYSGILPHAEIDSNPGGVGRAGHVILRVFYPPVPEESSKLENVAADVIEYFDCLVPEAPQPCANQVKDIGETDVDCGGAICGPCIEGLKCISNSDCASKSCKPDAMGLKKCQPGAMMPADGGGGGG